MTDTEIPSCVGGYRVGRSTGPSRYLGHIVSPAVVELVFVDRLSVTERESALRQAVDVASLSSGGRVAILSWASQQGSSPERLPLETPPELAAAWEEMRRQVAYREMDLPATPPDASWPESAPRTLAARVMSMLPKVRRRPVIVAAIAGVLVVILALLLIPGTDDSIPVAQYESSLGPSPTPVVASQHSPSPVPDATEQDWLPEGLGQPTIAPQSVIGDVALVALPPRDSGGIPGEPSTTQYAVLERDGETWILRDVYRSQTRL